MKILAFNGSPREKGNTYNAINMVAKELKKEEIEVEIIHIGNKPLSGCIACGKCKENKNERCAIDDEVNEWIQKMKVADGIILGSPVYYSSIAGNMKCFLDRAFYVCGVNNGILRHKVGASVVVARRSGGVSAFSQLNKYLMYSEMLIATSCYWNVIYGHKEGEALKDSEGQQIMSILGRNMAWIIKLLNSNIETSIKQDVENRVFMNFIR